MKTRTHLILLLCVLTATWVAVSFVRSRRVPTVAAAGEAEPPAAVQTETATPSLPAPQTPSNGFSTYRWHPGEHACWQFGVSLRLAGKPEKLAESGETRLGGRLQLVVLNSDSERVTVAAALSDAWYVAGGQRVGRFEEFLNSTPAVLTLNPSGKLLALAFPPHVAAEDRKILRLAYGWEFVARDATSYQEDEHAPGDAKVRFRATYRRSENNRIQKMRFLSPASVAQPDASQSVIASEFTGTVGKVWVSEMAGWEDSTIHLNGELFAMSRVAVSFKQLTNAPALAPVLNGLLSNPDARLAFSEASDPGAYAQRESVSRAVRREALAVRWGTVPFDQVRDAIHGVADGPMRNVTKPLQNFEEWLVVHAEAGPAMVLQSLQGLRTDQTSLSGLLVHGLAEADTAPARKALAAILDVPDAFPPAAVIQAAVAVGGFGSKAEPALKETLVRLMDSPVSDGTLSDTALFAFARIAKDDVVSQQYLVQRVAPWLEANASPEDTVKGLSALANAALDDPRLVERAMGLARSTHADIRLAVVDFLGSLPSSSPGRVAIDHLVSDPDPQVRQEAERVRVQ